MHPSFLFVSTLLFLGVSASPIAKECCGHDDSTVKVSAAGRPVYWLLSGNSTTASGSGWGDGFLNKTVANGAGHNYAFGGATTKTFQDAGAWKKVLSDIPKYKDMHDVRVTIQFGHNDQKKGMNVTMDEYKTNLALFARQVKEAGGTPVSIHSSSTCSNFSSTSSSQRLRLYSSHMTVPVSAHTNHTP
jgi:lysophospholipase L1-like esterase